MSQYRRFFQPGGTFFLTIVTANRRPLFKLPANVARFREAVTAVRASLPFDVLGAVVLPDHTHFMWALPDGDAGYSKRLGMIKVAFTRSLPKDVRDRLSCAPSKKKHRESGVWQRRFWEHTIRDERDFETHMDYIHYNPIKHGFVSCAHAWPYSSFQRWVRAGHYSPQWCCACKGRSFEPPAFSKIEDLAGE